MARHNKPPKEVGYWTERDLRQARDWKAAGFSFSDIAKAMKRDTMHVQIKWEQDAFSLEVKPKTKRNCLACSVEFDSDGPHHRICNTCRERRATNSSAVEDF